MYMYLHVYHSPRGQYLTLHRTFRGYSRLSPIGYTNENVHKIFPKITKNKTYATAYTRPLSSCPSTLVFLDHLERTFMQITANFKLFWTVHQEFQIRICSLSLSSSHAVSISLKPAESPYQTVMVSSFTYLAPKWVALHCVYSQGLMLSWRWMYNLKKPVALGNSKVLDKEHVYTTIQYCKHPSIRVFIEGNWWNVMSFKII